MTGKGNYEQSLLKLGVFTVIYNSSNHQFSIHPKNSITGCVPDSVKSQHNFTSFLEKTADQIPERQVCQYYYLNKLIITYIGPVQEESLSRTQLRLAKLRHFSWKKCMWCARWQRKIAGYSSRFMKTLQWSYYDSSATFTGQSPTQRTQTSIICAGCSNQKGEKFLSKWFSPVNPTSGPHKT